MNKCLLSMVLLSANIAVAQGVRKDVILDTDIVGDIDDTWALGMLLNSPELNLKMVSVGTGNPAQRAQVVAKFLDKMNRTDVAIGIGLYSAVNGTNQKQLQWAADYDLTKYPGKIYQHGIDAMIQMLEDSAEPTLIAIGPLMDVQQLCLRRPDLCAKTHLVAMAGSIYKGYDNKQGAAPEWNVVCQIPEAQTVFSTTWKSVTITPLDTCGLVRLKSERYQKLRNSNSPLVKMVLENYRHWLGKPGETSETASSILFDTVAVYLAYTHDNLVMETVNVEVDNQGVMRTNTPKGKPVNAAVNWIDLEAYEEYLIQRLMK